MNQGRILAMAIAVALGMFDAIALAQAPQTGDDTGLESVTVTAQRRSEHLLEVPATVNVISASRLEAAHITNSFELSQLTPAVAVVTLGSYSQPAIRGITTQVVGVGNPPNVALYVDGIYVAAQDAYNFDFLGVDRIEVLKGPQGVLYGRNATGGAILVTTKKPSFDPSATLSVSYGNLDAYNARLYATGPLTSTLAANIAVLARGDDGYIHNITTGHDVGQNHTVSARGQLLFQPNDASTWVLSVDHTNFDNPIGWDSSTMNGNSVARARPGVVLSSRPYDVNITLDPSSHNNQTGGALRGDVALGWGQVTTLTGYRYISSFENSDSAYSPLPLSRNERTANEETFSQEFNVSSTAEGRLQWIFGALYARDDARNDPVVANGVVNVRNHTRDDASSAFGELTYDLTSRLSAIGGVRYSYERERMRGSFGNPRTPPVASEAAWSAWTPRFSLRDRVGKRTNVYATYSRGFKSGGYNTNNANPTIPFNPETVDAYEAGVKSAFAKGITVEAATYYYDYKDEQVTAVISTAGVSATQVLNAASAAIYGGEIQIGASPVEGLNLELGAAYTHDRFTRFPNALLTLPKPPTATGPCSTGNPPCGNRQFTGDASGERLVRIPDFTLNLGANYKHPIGYGLLEPSANVYWSSGWYQAFNNRLHQQSYTVVNTEIAWLLPNGKYKLAMWAKNLTGQVYSLMMSDSSNGDRLVFAPPRTYGVTLEANF